MSACLDVRTSEDLNESHTDGSSRLVISGSILDRFSPNFHQIVANLYVVEDVTVSFRSLKVKGRSYDNQLIFYGDSPTLPFATVTFCTGD